MAEIEKIEKISKLKKDAKVDFQPIAEPQEPARMGPNKERFDALMGQKVEKTTALDGMGKTTSLLDEMRNLNHKVDRFSKMTPQDLVVQADDVIHQIEDIKKKLATPALDLHPSTQNVLHNKLAHIDENLRVALSKAGLEYKPAENFENKTVNPIERFLGFLTNGQAQLASLSNEVETMHLNNKELSPANMLRIQMKVGYITQEIEFFTAVLNKALDSTKTIMNVQV